MDDISAHFSKKEATCKCGCGQTIINQKLVAILEDLRAWAKCPVFVSSWNRCIKYNTRVGGAPGSKHLTGQACDVKVQGKTPQEVYDYLNKKYGSKIGLGSYKTFTHVDVYGKGRRWRG